MRFTMLKYLAWVGQFGLTVVLPPVIALLGAGWLRGRFGLGGWVTPAALALGLASAGWNLIRFLKLMLREAERSEKNKHGR